MVLNDNILPVVLCPIPLCLLSCIILIFDVHPRVAGVVPHGKLAELFGKELSFALDLLLVEGGLMLFLDLGLLAFDELLDSVLLLERVLWPLRLRAAYRTASDARVHEMAHAVGTDLS